MASPTTYILYIYDEKHSPQRMLMKCYIDVVDNYITNVRGSNGTNTSLKSFNTN